MSVTIVHPVPSDIDIAQDAELRPIADVAAGLGLGADDLDLYGRHKAKIYLDVLDRLRDKPLGHDVDVTTITPTPLGEGKTTTTVGLCQALGAHLGKNVVTVVRQPRHDPALKGVPKGFRLPVWDIRVSAGAGFLYPLCGDMRTMPGLSTRPGCFNVDLDLGTGKVRGSI